MRFALAAGGLPLGARGWGSMPPPAAVFREPPLERLNACCARLFCAEAAARRIQAAPPRLPSFPLALCTHLARRPHFTPSTCFQH